MREVLVLHCKAENVVSKAYRARIIAFSLLVIPMHSFRELHVVLSAECPVNATQFFFSLSFYRIHVTVTGACMQYTTNCEG